MNGPPTDKKQRLQKQGMVTGNNRKFQNNLKDGKANL